MAQFDLKNAIIKLKDGYSGPGGSPVVNHILADPVSAPTATATGGGSSGGFLAAATYLVSYTFLTVLGETLRSPDSSPLVVGAGNIPRVTLPALPSGATGINLYLSTAGGGTGTENKYNVSPILTNTYDLAVAQPVGASPPGASTAGLRYLPGATTIAVSGYTGAVVTGDFFSVVGDPASGTLAAHRITGHSETLGNTTSLTFTGSATTGNVDHGAVVTILPRQIELILGDGNFSYDEKKARVYTKNRGKLYTVRNGDEEPVDVKLDFLWESLRASTGNLPTVEDILKNRGEASTWVSSDTDPCAPFAVDIEIKYRPPCNTVQYETITLNDFRYESLNHDAKTGQVAMTGKCNVTEPTTVRSDT